MTSPPRDRKLFAGLRLRRLRLQLALTQSRMAEDLGVSISYLNLIERNQRPLTAAVLLRLSQVYNLDLRQLTGDDAERAADDVRQMLADPLLRGLDIGRAEIHDFVDSAPGIAQALARLYGAWRDRAQAPAGDIAAEGEAGPIEAVRAFIQDRRNHFPEIETRAEAVADELRLAPGGLAAAIAERLRSRHNLSVRVLPVDIMPDYLRRLDYHGRQLQLSELLDESSRLFAAAYQLGLIEAKSDIEAIAATTQFADKAAERLLTQNLASYFAAALMMPYARFHAAAESTGYDVELLACRFGAGFEQVAHRFTTLQRPGSRGVPFFLIRVDRAGNVSKRFAAGRFPFATYGGTCPLWSVHRAFERPTELITQVLEMEDGARYFSIARSVYGHAAGHGTVRPQFAVALCCELSHAHGLVYVQGVDLDAGLATPIGITCSLCHRAECSQRSVPPAGERLRFDERIRGASPFNLPRQ